MNISGVVQGYYNNQAAVFSLANLMVTGGITSDTGSIRAFTVKGSATDNVTLKGNINYIGDFTATNKDFTLTDVIAVELRGALDVGTGTVKFNTPGVTFWHQ